VALQLQMEEAAGREGLAHGFMAEVSERLQRAHEAMVAKDDLLSSLEHRLKKSLAELTSSDERLKAARDEAVGARRVQQRTVQELEVLQERHELVTSDFRVASEALDSYRETLVTAEVRMARDRERVQALQLELRDLHGQIQSGGGGSTGALLLPGGGAAALPTGAEAGASRVHYLYFLSSLLLIKTALSQQGQMANVGAQDVFDEIVRNAVPLEEWPTYIFTRLFSARGAGASDHEVAALKAVAKKQNTQHVGPSLATTAPSHPMLR